MKSACLAGALLLTEIAVVARVLHVPAEYGSIQTAIDAAVDYDTISVEVGLYQEALTVTNRSLTIIGASTPDTVSGVGATIDPTNSIDANELACLSLIGGDSVKLERLWFRNGPAMHFNRSTNDPGGIDNEIGPNYLKLKSCRFDSVHIGIRHGRVVVLDSVVMHDMQRSCMTHGGTAQFIATDCRFEGAMTGIAVTAWSGSRFTRCSFKDSDGAYLLTAGKDSLQIKECDFELIEAGCSYIVIIRPGFGTVIEDNLFHDMNNGSTALIVNAANCSTIVDPAYQYPIIRNNRFHNIGPGTACQEGFALQLKCDGWANMFLGTVEGNIFEDSHSQGFFANAIDVTQGGARLLGNQFVNLLPDHCPAVYTRYVQSPDTLVLRENEFDSIAFGVGHSTGLEITDARWNWWGDNSGPFNPTLNPTGLGAEVDDGVLFEPWIMHEDTTDTNSVADDDPSVLHPSLFTLSAYPNPFNAVTTLMIEVARAGEYEVLLYDVTGRVTANVFSGRIESSQRVVVDAAGLASGVYFAQLRGADGVLAVGKVLSIR